MKKIFTFLLLGACIFGTARAQVAVTDPVFTGAYLGQSINQNNRLSAIEDNNRRIRDMQVFVNVQLNEIRQLQQTTYNYLRQAQGIVRNIGQLQQAMQIFDGIYNHAQQAVTLAWGDPVLLTVARDTQREVLRRGYALIGEITSFALADGSNNLLDSKQRIDFMNGVINELRILRGITFSVLRQMQTAQRNGINWSTVITGGARQQFADKRRIADGVIRDVQRINPF
jgi:hypothetical protein